MPLGCFRDKFSTSEKFLNLKQVFHLAMVKNPFQVEFLSSLFQTSLILQ